MKGDGQTDVASGAKKKRSGQKLLACSMESVTRKPLRKEKTMSDSRLKGEYFRVINGNLLSAAEWGNISQRLRTKLITALWVAGWGVDEAIELLFILCDEMRKYAKLYYVCQTAEVNNSIIHADLVPRGTNGGK